MFNSFANIDDNLNRIILKSIEIFENNQTNDNYSFYYYNSITKEKIDQNLEESLIKMQRNPISNYGRVCILKGCLQNINLNQGISNIKLPIKIVNSKSNFLISSNQIKIFSTVQKKENEENNVENKLKRNFVFNIEGGYNIFDVKISKKNLLLCF